MEQKLKTTAKILSFLSTLLTLSLQAKSILNDFSNN